MSRAVPSVEGREPKAPVFSRPAAIHDSPWATAYDLLGKSFLVLSIKRKLSDPTPNCISLREHYLGTSLCITPFGRSKELSQTGQPKTTVPKVRYQQDPAPCKGGAPRGAGWAGSPWCCCTW